MVGDSQLSIHGVSVPLQSRPASLTHVRRVYVRECVAVPSDHTPSGNWIVEAKEIRPGLLLSPSLVSDKDSHPAIQLLNISGKQHYLPAGLNIGLAEHSGDDVLFPATHTGHAAPGDLPVRTNMPPLIILCLGQM